jgi:hypothetical protein
MDAMGNNNYYSIAAWLPENTALQYCERNLFSYRNEDYKASHPHGIFNLFFPKCICLFIRADGNYTAEFFKNKKECKMSIRNIRFSSFITSVLFFCVITIINNSSIFAQEVLNSAQIDQMKLTGELKNDGSLWVRDFKNERGELTSLTIFDIKEDILKEITHKGGKADINNDDAVAKFNCFGKPVLVCKHGLVVLRRLSMETIVDYLAWPVEITSANLTAYPQKDGWGILEINGKKELVIFSQRGSDSLIRTYKAGKDPS